MPESLFDQGWDGLPVGEEWADEEFGDLHLGDPRRARRLQRVARALGARPGASLPGAFEEKGELRGCYRFFQNDRVKREAILEGPIKATYRRLNDLSCQYPTSSHCAITQEAITQEAITQEAITQEAITQEAITQKAITQEASHCDCQDGNKEMGNEGNKNEGNSKPLVILAVQDTCYLDYTSHPATEGMGPLNQGNRMGVMMHTTMAFTPENVPFGLLGQKTWVRDPQTYARLPDHKEREIQDKESCKWIEGLRNTITAHEHCPGIHFISVGDREADVYDLFLEPRPEGVDVLVRAIRDRKAEHPQKYLWAAMASVDVAATFTLKIPARDRHAAREAQVAIRYSPITLRPPNCRSKESLSPVNIWAVWVVETTPQTVSQAASQTVSQAASQTVSQAASQAESSTKSDPKTKVDSTIKPVEWMLLSTAAVRNTEEALERVRWYCCRWGIELWHKILKSGCRIEQRQLQSAQRLEKLLVVLSVIAWRIQFGTMLAREMPDVPCTVMLEEEEWKALYCAIEKVSVIPKNPPTLRQAMRWIAKLGGFLGRKHDGEPGVTVMWRGMQRLRDITMMFNILYDASRQPPPDGIVANH